MSLKRQVEEMARENAVEEINHLWPPDSEYTDTATKGREDMIEALCAEWRSLPVPVLEHMAQRQRYRDNRS